ncbi:MAG TPA: alpha-L-fucosidase [Candidatus Nanopelagicaceae bacterium]
MSNGGFERNDGFERFARPIPKWFTDAKFGIFIHWGAYSVPAWAEPTGELGVVPEDQWFAHNPYAEWYFNTIRIEGSPAATHQKEIYGAAPYDDFLDEWKATKFNPDDWAQLFKKAGAQYVIPVTKHHDGITLWDAPGTGTRNSVARGPKRDLVSEIGSAVRTVGIKFGAYYSGGLDWSVSALPPITLPAHVKGLRPSDAAYAMYCYEHIIDLIDRYRPDVLWNDIDYPDFAKREGPYSLASIFDHYYKVVPNGVVNDRWGVSHNDYKTSEYQHTLENESGIGWENNRGIGFSFGYNKQESEKHYKSIKSALHHLIDIVSRGGNLLLNVGPTADGEIPAFQRQVLEGMGNWLSVNGEAIYGSSVAKNMKSTNEPWIRWTQKDKNIYAIIESSGNIEFEASGIAEGTARILGGPTLHATRSGSKISVSLETPKAPGPTVIAFDI